MFISLSEFVVFVLVVDLVFLSRALLKEQVVMVTDGFRTEGKRRRSERRTSDAHATRRLADGDASGVIDV